MGIWTCKSMGAFMWPGIRQFIVEGIDSNRFLVSWWHLD